MKKIVIDAKGNKWIATWGGGLVKLPRSNSEGPDSTNWIIYNTSNSDIPTNSIQSLAIDNNTGEIWIGTNGTGLVVLWPNKSLSESEMYKPVNVKCRIYHTSNSKLSNDNIEAITIDKDGNKWIATWGGGLIKLSLPHPHKTQIPENDSAEYADPGIWTIYNTLNSGLPENWIRSVAIDQQNNKWIGTGWGGLVKFSEISTKDPVWTIYNTTNSALPYNLIRSIAIDNSDNLWIGTDNGGLVHFDGKNWQIYNRSNSGLPNDYVGSIAIDNNGNKWIATWFGGLTRFDGETFKVYNIANSGLPYNLVSSITIDQGGNIWIGTLIGLAKFDASKEQ
ncbi:MAG: hypothetical protein IIA88_07875 [Bacteroidetes bacterium]|nr:hypothetical protein [Bacteroidota bacterium]